MGVTFRRLASRTCRWSTGGSTSPAWCGGGRATTCRGRPWCATPTDSTEHWITSVDGRDVGWIQCYAVVDSPEEAAQWEALGVDRTAAGIDYLLGEPADRGRGLGTVMIRTFVADVVFARQPAWSQACAAPQAGNVASWRALEKAGFRFVGMVEDKTGSCRLMVADGRRRCDAVGP